MRQSWSDDRLDHLNARVEAGFEAVDKRFEAVDERFEVVDRRLDRVEQRLGGLELRLVRFEARFEAFEARQREQVVELTRAIERVDRRMQNLEEGFLAMNRMLLQLFGAFIGTLVLAIGGFLATRL